MNLAMASYPVKSSGLHLEGSVFSAGTGREEEGGWSNLEIYLVKIALCWPIL